jgi:hypothetical protein
MERMWREVVWPKFRYRFQNLPRGTEENHETPQSGQPVSGPRFEPGISRIRIRCVNHSTWKSVQQDKTGLDTETSPRAVFCERTDLIHVLVEESITSTETLTITKIHVCHFRMHKRITMNRLHSTHSNYNEVLPEGRLWRKDGFMSPVTQY